MNTINKKNMYDLNAASEKLVSNYQEPGIFDNVKISDIKLGETSVNKVSYIELHTVGDKGALGKSNKMFLSTDVKEGKKMSAWSITARNLVDLISITNNTSEEEAKGAIKGVESKEQLVSKLSAILVGKPFRAKFKGEISEKGLTFATLDSIESMSTPKEQSRLRFNPDRDIKKHVNANPAPQQGAVASDLPF